MICCVEIIHEISKLKVEALLRLESSFCVGFKYILQEGTTLRINILCQPSLFHVSKVLFRKDFYLDDSTRLLIVVSYQI